MPAPTQTEPAQHGLAEHSHGAGAPVPVQSRSERFRSVVHADFPEVTGREVDWKYTPVDTLRDLIDGELDGTPTAFTSPDAEGTTVAWIPMSDARVGSALVPEDRASANARGAAQQALLVRVDGETTETRTVVRDAFGAEPRAAHTVIEATPNSDGLVILEHTGSASLAENVEILVRDGARLTVVTVQEWDDDARHLSTHVAQVGRDATLTHVVVSLGGRVVRVNPTSELVGQGADAEMYGLYFSDSGQHLEQQVYVHHEAPNTRSRVTYKGALNGAGARSVWIGDVLIGRDATGTDSYEQNRNLVLSEGTRADSIPNLEIETGDIAGAGHASATGRFDDEQLFYLAARGIPEKLARRLVVIGFLAEVVQKIADEGLRTRLLEAIERELDAAAAVA